MLKTVSNKIASFLIAKKMLQPKQKDMFIYSFQTRILTITTMIVLIIIGGFKSGFINASIFVIILILFRKRTGGYHAPTAYRCFLLSIALVSVSFYLILPILQDKSYALMLFIYVTSVSAIIIFAPINHPNINMSGDEIKANKIKVYNYIVAISIVLLSLIIIQYDRQLPTLIILSVFIVACSVLISKIIGQEVKKDEEN